MPAVSHINVLQVQWKENDEVQEKRDETFFFFPTEPGLLTCMNLRHSLKYESLRIEVCVKNTIFFLIFFQVLVTSFFWNLYRFLITNPKYVYYKGLALVSTKWN